MAREMLVIGDERTPYQLCSPAWQRPPKPAPLGGSPIPRPAAQKGQARFPVVSLRVLPWFGPGQRAWEKWLWGWATISAPRLASCVILDKLGSGT